jgi:hypothetical protein
MYEWIEPSDFVYQTIDLVQAQEPKNKVSEAGRRVIGWAGASLWLAHQRARLHASTRKQEAGRIGTASLRTPWANASQCKGPTRVRICPGPIYTLRQESDYLRMLVSIAPSPLASGRQQGRKRNLMPRLSVLRLLLLQPPSFHAHNPFVMMGMS